jgi:hypothetical protein
MAQDEHHKMVDHRGDQVMGFSHEKTTHHFRLFSDGGAIEVTANDQRDEESRAQIRMHLAHIAGMFTAGNFKAPMLIHDQTPPGVPTLQRLREQVTYRYEDIPGGGRVRIATRNAEAVLAVHQFLRFQIVDHRTGDTTEIGKETPGGK